MSIRIKIQEVTFEEVRNGKNKYDKAEVVHTANGQNRTQKIMSFSNPAVFQQVRNMKPGEEYDITVTKNDGGYNQWAKVERASSEDSPLSTSPGAKSTGATVQRGSSYETPDERARRQVLIVKQSCLAQSIAACGDDIAGTPIDNILNRAQQFVDWVMADDTQALDGEDPSVSQE